MRFHQYLLRRIAVAVPTLLLAVTAVFFAIRLAPGDPASIILGQYHDDKESVARVHKELGLDKPLPAQYGHFVMGLLQGDLGKSYRTSRPVSEEIGRTIGPTLTLAAAAMLLSLAIGIPLGVITARRQNTVTDYTVMLLAFLGVSMPVFWSGLMLMMLFSLKLNLLPAVGYDSWQGLILPAVTLAAPTLALTARLTRAEMLEVIRKDFIRTARAKGAGERMIMYRHALRNAMLPVVTAAGIKFGGLLAGSVLTERVFAWPGLGSLMIKSISSLDYAVVQGAVILIAAIFSLINLLVDLTYALLDPRVAYD